MINLSERKCRLCQEDESLVVDVGGADLQALCVLRDGRRKASPCGTLSSDDRFSTILEVIKG